MITRFIHNEEDYREALKQEGAYLLILGDSGGEVYVTCPIIQIHADLNSVFLLMLDLEALSTTGRLSDIDTTQDIPSAGYDAWTACGDFRTGVELQGASFTECLWISTELMKRGLMGDIFAVLKGEIRRVNCLQPCE